MLHKQTGERLSSGRAQVGGMRWWRRGMENGEWLTREEVIIGGAVQTKLISLLNCNEFGGLVT